ncbi:alpha-ribazole kinase [Desulfosporosinus sp. PR]|uniref:AIR synthase related protein n=1 Tax=Candidatus Desulfosporosinus nitrosoreducens TaxID=3401928 RepID=UPI0027EE7946|nr:AIR synthase related protein [Desulfosporosinus sp. PR]MDQ7093463.1 alpha-ribazole kinase [Desulfosporosinus sp. PR]
MGYRGRDIEVVAINPEQYLVASCDSCGAIGLKILDVVQVPWTITGRLTARVALLEILAVGAGPQVMTVAISNEPQPTGEELLKGVNEELAFAGLTLPMAISTEKNMKTQETALGISVVGLVGQKQLRIGTSQPGDEVFCLGLPKVGPEAANPEDPEIIQLMHLKRLLGISEIHDMIPVGSRGIRAEADQLASNSHSRLLVDPSCPLNLAKSAGPSTCLILSASRPVTGPVFSDFKQMPIHKIGKLI